jgi:hypothetical protein
MAMNMDAMLRIKADVQGENNIRRLGNSMQGLQGQVKNAALGFNSLKGAVAGFGAAIAGSAVVAGLGAIVKKSIDAGDELFNLQAKTGVAANQLIGIGNAAKLADVDLGTLGKGLTKLNVNLVKAAEGNEDLASKFKRLGVDVKDASGQVVPADKALKQIADRFADMPDGAQKAAAAVALFGKSGADLIPLLNEGAASMEKFTFKIGEDFAARSDLFNDTITEFGIKTQGFGLELTDALLPALQSILEVFGELFDSKTDWTDLFNVIKYGISGLAAVLLAMVKLVDEAVRLIGSFAKRAALAFKGDFAGATAEADRFGADFMKRFQANMGQFQKLFSDAPSPGTGRRTGGRNIELDTSAIDERNAAAARKAAAEAKRAAAEQERLEDRRATLTQKAISLQDQLRNSVADVVATYEGVGASKIDQLFLQRNEAITENNRLIKKLTFDVIQLVRDVNEAGGSLEVKPFEDLINQLSRVNVDLADKSYQQGLKDLLPTLEEYDAKIKEVQLGKAELTEVEKLNAEINLLQLDILAQTNPALAEQIRLLRERAGVLDAATKKQEESNRSFGEQFKQTFKDAYDSATNLGANLAGIATNGIDGLTNAIVDFASTGKAAFKEFAASVLQELGKMLIKFAIFKAIKAFFPGLGFAATGGATGPNSAAPLKTFATGGVMSNSVVPLRRYAAGGIARSPQMAIYGERGPEAYVPLPDGRSIPVKMDQRGEALNRYKPMGATGTMATDGEPGAAGPASAAAGGPIDVRYTVERINNVEYVTADQFRQGMQQAAAEGAQRGQQRTLRSLQQSTAVRSRIGIR